MLPASTVSRVLPAKSPILPAVEAIDNSPEVRGEEKLVPTIELRAERVIELGAVSAPAKDNPPLVEVIEMSVAVTSEPAVELTVPDERRLKTVPAAESALMLVAAPVF